MEAPAAGTLYESGVVEASFTKMSPLATAKVPALLARKNLAPTVSAHCPAAAPGLLTTVVTILLFHPYAS